jgi:hypothetical protein
MYCRTWISVSEKPLNFGDFAQKSKSCHHYWLLIAWISFSKNIHGRLFQLRIDLAPWTEWPRRRFSQKHNFFVEDVAAAMMKPKGAQRFPNALVVTAKVKSNHLSDRLNTSSSQVFDGVDGYPLVIKHGWLGNPLSMGAFKGQLWIIVGFSSKPRLISKGYVWTQNDLVWIIGYCREKGGSRS